MNLTVDVRAEQLLSQLAGAGDRFGADMAIVVDRLSIEIQGLVKETKLTGQVLHVQSGTLRRSINRKVTKSGSAIVAEVGTNVRYAAIHEYGFDGDVNVKAHQRAGHNVRAHVRSMHMPERSFLRSTLIEQTAHIKEAMREAAVRSLRKSVTGVS